MLNSKQRSYLKSLSNKMDALFQVGKGGINENVIKQFYDALEARELVKVSVLNNSLISTREICDEIASVVGADVVNVIGNKFVLYRESRENKTIKLPK